MEIGKQMDAKLLAIMQFIHRYDPEVSVSSLLNGTSFSKLILQIPASQFDFNLKINKLAAKWSDQLQNVQGILFKIEEYFQHIHQKSLNTMDLDLIAMTKNKQLSQVVKYFQIVMILLMESSMKEYFIESIMMLQESSQQIFVEIIKHSLESNRFTQTKYKSNLFNRLISEFDEEKQTMQKEIERLCKANTDLLDKVKQYEEIIQQTEANTSNKKNIVDGSFEEGKSVQYLEEYIDRLQIRIIEQGKIYEEEKMSNLEKVADLQTKITKLEEAEELCKIYKQKYEQIMDQMQKMNIWKREKSKMEKVMQEKDFMVQKLNDRIEELTQKNLSLQQSELDYKLQLEKKQLKIQKMSTQLKKVMDNMGNSNNSFSTKANQNVLLDQNNRDCIKNGEDSLVLGQEQNNQLKKEIEKLLKKNKQQEKQICKLNKKVQKLRVLEQDKSKLEHLVFQLRVTQSQELNLMFAAFYEGFQQNLQASKKLRHAVLNFKQEEQIARKSKHFRKKTGSNLSKGKQNLTITAENSYK